MKIKILTNSQETMQQARTMLSSLDISHGFSFGGSSEFEVLSKNSWVGKLFHNLDKLVSVFSPLDQSQKNVAELILKSSEKLDKYLSAHENNYLKDSSLFIHTDNSLNKGIRSVVNEVVRLLPKQEVIVEPTDPDLKKIMAGVQFQNPCAYLKERKIVMNTGTFSSFLPDESIPQLVASKYGQEKAIDFTMLHEFSHISQDINDDLLGNSNDPKTIKFVKIVSKLAFEKDYIVDFNSQVHDINTFFKEIEVDKKYPFIDKDFVNQLAIVQREIYADVGAILHLRNIDIQNNTYNPEAQNEFIDDIIKYRQIEQNAIGNKHSSYTAIFDHFTSPGVEHLKELMVELGNQELSQEDIHDTSNACIQQGLAQIILTLNYADNYSIGQFNTLFNTDRKYDELANTHTLILSSVDDTKDPVTEKRFVKSIAYYKKLVGEAFYDNLEKSYEELNSLDLPRVIKDKLIWQSSLDPNLYEQSKNELEFYKDIINQAPTLTQEVSSSLLDKFSKIREHFNPSGNPKRF